MAKKNNMSKRNAYNKYLIQKEQEVQEKSKAAQARKQEKLDNQWIDDLDDMKLDEESEPVFGLKKKIKKSKAKKTRKQQVNTKDKTQCKTNIDRRKKIERKARKCPVQYSRDLDM